MFYAFGPSLTLINGCNKCVPNFQLCQTHDTAAPGTAYSAFFLVSQGRYFVRLKFLNYSPKKLNSRMMIPCITAKIKTDALLLRNTSECVYFFRDGATCGHHFHRSVI